MVQSVEEDVYEAPSAVMQTAITPHNASGSIQLRWEVKPNTNYPSPGCMFIMHFSELQLLQENTIRTFNISINNKIIGNITPDYLYADASLNNEPLRGSIQYNITLHATANSTMPPIINALEVFSIISTTTVPTNAKDGKYQRFHSHMVKIH